MSEKVETIEVDVESVILDNMKAKVKLSADNTVVDLAREVAQKFGKEAINKGYKSFALMFNGDSITTDNCKSTKISSVFCSTKNGTVNKNITNYFIMVTFSKFTPEASDNNFFCLDDYLPVEEKKNELNNNLMAEDSNEKKETEKQDVSKIKENSQKESGGNNSDGKKSSWPLLKIIIKIIIGVIDLLLLAAAAITFLLFFLTSLIHSIEIPIVLTVLFLIGAALFFGLDSILPKILPRRWSKKINLRTGLDEKEKEKEKEEEKEKSNSPNKETEKDKITNQID